MKLLLLSSQKIITWNLK